jgi:hypothetical protein
VGQGGGGSGEGESLREASAQGEEKGGDQHRGASGIVVLMS